LEILLLANKRISFPQRSPVSFHELKISQFSPSNSRKPLLHPYGEQEICYFDFSLNYWSWSVTKKFLKEMTLMFLI